MSVVRNVIIGVVLASIFVICISGFITSLANSTGLIEDTSTLNSTYNKMGNIRNITQDMETELANAKLEQSSIWLVTTEAPFKTLKLMFKSIEVAYSMIASMSSDITGMPVWVTSFALMFITVTIAMVILGAFLRWRT